MTTVTFDLGQIVAATDIDSDTAAFMIQSIADGNEVSDDAPILFDVGNGSQIMGFVTKDAATTYLAANPDAVAVAWLVTQVTIPSA